ncbi:hypothetical protein [Paenibacillus albus]|uniref:S-layer homology domain-containing protein n=1 Tax=Paenibacillus albus TaxID=2495582 RepID=A0A3S9A0D8_9BACL|nr:hypothetical protein [Paenibacillus albus]AZN39200.1 hypothetical protein EJC50_05615 [Paenibacillus albus]
MKQKLAAGLLSATLLLGVVSPTVSFAAEVTADQISIVNNVGGKDTITVTGLAVDDIVKVYSSSEGGEPIISGSVDTGATEVTVEINQLGTAAGSVYVSVVSGGEESELVEATYNAESSEGPSDEPSEAPEAAQITVTNNATGANDTVIVSELAEGDLVSVYSAASGGELLATAEVESGEEEATVSKTDMLKAAGGTVYVTVTSPNMLESPRVAMAYAKEATSKSPLAASIIIENNPTGTKDTVMVNDLAEGDIVRLYNTLSGGTAQVEAVVESGQTSVEISSFDPEDPDKPDMLRSTGGTIYVTVTNINKLESARIAKSYATEPVSSAPISSSITVKNYRTGIKDKVIVSGLAEGGVINVYRASSGGTSIGTATVAEDESGVTILIDQLGVNAGNVYISQKKAGKLESTVRTVKTYEAEASVALQATAISITNNGTGSLDKVNVTGLAEGDVINVYTAATGGTALATGTAEAGEEDEIAAEASLLDMLNINGGTVYVSVTRVDKAESARIAKTYTSEPVSKPLAAADITVVNNKTGTSDSVTVTNLSAGDVVKVYKTTTGGTAIGTATVDEDETSATVEITQLGTAAGSVYVGVKRVDLLESTVRTVKAYGSEQSTAPTAAAITIVNSPTGKEDTVTVTGLAAGDEVKVYGAAKGGEALATETVNEDETSVTLSKADMLTATGGTAYITVTKPGKLESLRTAKTYVTEPVSAGLATTAVSIVNNKAGVNDTVVVTGLNAGDTINVYRAATGGTAIGTAAVATGESSATASVEQLGAAGGTAYVSVKRVDQLESKVRLAKKFDTETSAAPAAASVTIVNGPTGKADTVKVTGLAAGDSINVYGVSKAGTALATQTVASNQTEATASLADMLTATGGTAYVTVTKVNKVESARVAKSYSSEAVSAALAAAVIAVENNKEGVSDTVTVTDLQEGDKILVYKTATGGTAAGTATVGAGATKAIASVEQLGVSAGTVYVSVKRVDQLESKRVAKTYATETGAAPTAAVITITNNSTGKADTVKVTGLAVGDVVSVYDSTKATTPLETAVVGAGATEATVSKADLLTATGGTAYVTVTRVNKRESARVAKTYITEPVSAAVAAGAITVANNRVGVSDKVTVTGLAAGDKVFVYKLAVGGTALGEAVVESGATSAVVSVDQLGAVAGTLYVGVKRADQLESKTRTGKKYDAETTTPVASANIAVTNNKSAADSVKVVGLQAGDVVKVYQASSGGTAIGTGTVESGSTSVTISIDQLSTTAGKVYVSITRGDKQESVRTAKDYAKE